MQAAGNCQPDDGYRYALLIADCLRTVGGRGYRGGCVELFRGIFSEQRRIEFACICTPQWNAVRRERLCWGAVMLYSTVQTSRRGFILPRQREVGNRNRHRNANWKRPDYDEIQPHAWLTHFLVPEMLPVCQERLAWRNKTARRTERTSERFRRIAVVSVHQPRRLLQIMSNLRE
jgi:hypothetical protein